MLSTKLWFVTQVAMAITARPIMDASNTRHPSCSRMGIRIFTIALHAGQLVSEIASAGGGSGGGSPERRGCQSAHATRELQLRDAGDDGVGMWMCGREHPIPRWRFE